MMTITILLFARAKELVGTNRIALEVPEGAIAADIRRELGRIYPALAGLAQQSALAMNDDIVADECRLFPHAELALLPPVSGG